MNPAASLTARPCPAGLVKSRRSDKSNEKEREQWIDESF